MRLIDADKLIGALHDCTFMEGDDRKIVYAVIQKQPSAERKGKWLKAYGDHEAFGIRPFYRYCSECNELTVWEYNYCPHCGADMRGEEDDS